MRKRISLIFVFLFVLGIVGCNAQEEDFKQRRFYLQQSNFKDYINEAYGERADELVFNRPSRLKTLKNIYANSVVVVETSQEVPTWFEKFSTISLMKRYNPSVYRKPFDPETFNPFKFQFNFLLKEKQFFHVDGTQYYILIKPFKIRK